MEINPNIRNLFIKYLDDNIDKEEYDQLRNYFGEQTGSAELHTLIINALYQDHQLRQHEKEQLIVTVDKVQQKLREEIKAAKPQRLWLHRYLPYAAAVLLFVVVTITYYVVIHSKSIRPTEELVDDVLPGKQSATLTLADGKKVRLNFNAGHIADQAGVSITNTKDGLLYQNIENDQVSVSQLNTLSTGNGETYSVVLPDGTKVWLNASTTLRYTPTILERMERVVWVDGEAYFEVAKDKKHPFVVNSDGQKIEVLGTHFNVNTYKGLGKTITTLAEGSVKVSTDQTIQLLRPGQQAISNNGTISIEKADVEMALAWKAGMIYFNDAPLQEVMEEIARWYNVQIEYQSKINRTRFNGGFRRNIKLSEVLQILNAGNIHCRLIRDNNIPKIIVNTDQSYEP